MVDGLRNANASATCSDVTSDATSQPPPSNTIPFSGAKNAMSQRFFIDIVGSDAVGQHATADPGRRTSQPLLRGGRRGSRPQQGLVNKFEGDAALAVFGAPTELPTLKTPHWRPHERSCAGWNAKFPMSVPDRRGSRAGGGR